MSGSRLRALARSTVAAFFRFSSRCYRWIKPPADPRHRLGQKGERAAARHLRRHGYKVLYRNFRPRGGGEVDLVCRERRTSVLVFLEVKTRTRTDFGNPASAVNSAKRELITRGALAWLRMLDRTDIHFRFDIVEVYAEEKGLRCEVIQDAFQLPEHVMW